MNKPEWIITDETPQNRVIPFKEIFAIKHNVQSLAILWPLCSYYVNVRDKYFIVQGGKRIQMGDLADFENPRLFYAKRNRQDFSIGGDMKDLHVSYLLGIEGTVNGDSRVIYLEVSADGKLWRWKFER